MAEHFRILGIKTLKPSFSESRVIYEDKVQAIQKALYDKDDWLFFYKGVTINQDQSRIKMTKAALADYSLFDIKGLKISVSALVGKNEAGKSSAVDLMIRMINNLSAALLGEDFNFAAAEHLHFIDYVYGELCFQIGRFVYILEERGRSIRLLSYERHRGSGYEFLLRENEIIKVLNGSFDKDASEPLKGCAKVV